MGLFEGSEHQYFDRYKMLFRLQIAATVGCVFILSYAMQFYGSGSVIRIASVGILNAGASLFVGFLLGFIFCIPRTSKAADTLAAAGSDSNRESTAIAFSTVETNTNLVDISDWLTKILVGVGLVELNKIPHNLRLLAIFLGPGLRSDDTPHYVASSETFALGIVLFFFGAGFLIGYLWTRLYFQTALSELADLAHRVEKAWFDATNAEILLEEGRLDDAMRAVDSALKVGPANAKALFTKGRILKRLSQAGGVPGDKALLREALDYATRAARLIPNKGGPLYNMACYQALLGDAAVALKALRQAIQLNPRLKDEAVKDEDLASLRELDEFKALTSSPATSN